MGTLDCLLLILVDDSVVIGMRVLFGNDGLPLDMITKIKRLDFLQNVSEATH